MNNDTIICDIIKGTNKNGNSYEALQFSIVTEVGLYKTGLIFPSPLELSIIKKALSSRAKEIYSK